MDAAVSCLLLGGCEAASTASPRGGGGSSSSRRAFSAHAVHMRAREPLPFRFCLFFFVYARCVCVGGASSAFSFQEVVLGGWIRRRTN